jgi:exopolysaccharide biosynthesis polyprenyl glycosylphosphotransferase
MPFWLLKLAVIAVDLVVVSAAMVVAYHLRAVLPGHEVVSAPSRHLIVGALSLPLWLGIFVRYHLYRETHVAARRGELGRLAHAVGASVVGMALVAYVAKFYVARGWLALTAIVAFVLLAAEREVVRQSLAKLRRRGRLLRRVLIVGGDEEAIEMGTTLQANPALGYDMLGFVAHIPGTADSTAMGRIVEAVHASGADGVIVMTSEVEMATANRLARDLPEAGVHVEMVAALRDIAVERLSLRALGAFPILHIERVHRRGWRACAKRVFDIAGAGLALVFLAPLLAVVSLAIRLGSPGPVLYRQTRLGRDGRLFTLFKFRTMTADADQRLAGLLAMNEGAGPLFKIRDDPRITAVGRRLRRFSADELPQLWNVLRGEMTLVGPRPALPAEVAGWTPELHGRLRVKPGITGMWQVCGRTDTSFAQYCRLDLYYVDNWSLLVDLTILCKTVPAVLFRRGAY